jgi:hypothetical protein
MASRKCSGDNEEGLRNFVESVLYTTNECSEESSSEENSEESEIYKT